MKVQKLSKKRFIGSLCEHGHRYDNTPYTVRYKGCRTCCTCNALSVLDRKGQHEEYRNKPKNKKKMSKYQKQYREDKKRKNEKKYNNNYYLTVTKPKRKRDRHNKKLLRGMNHP